jgi:hypothetical protein
MFKEKNTHTDCGFLDRKMCESSALSLALKILKNGMIGSCAVFARSHEAVLVRSLYL